MATRQVLEVLHTSLTGARPQLPYLALAQPGFAFPRNERATVLQYILLLLLCSLLSSLRMSEYLRHARTCFSLVTLHVIIPIMLRGVRGVGDFMTKSLVQIKKNVEIL